jgi:hypothetical protein
LWCKIWFWIYLWFSIPKLNGWMNLLILWSQLTSQLHASQFDLNYRNS